MIKTTKDGRTIRTGKDYSDFRRDLHMAQEGKCVNCGKWMNLLTDYMYGNSMHAHHKNGRGMGGGYRDDTLEACVALCGACHRKEHNQ